MTISQSRRAAANRESRLLSIQGPRSESSAIAMGSTDEDRVFDAAADAADEAATYAADRGDYDAAYEEAWEAAHDVSLTGCYGKYQPSSDPQGDADILAPSAVTIMACAVVHRAIDAERTAAASSSAGAQAAADAACDEAEAAYEAAPIDPLTRLHDAYLEMLMRDYRQLRLRS